MDGISWNMLKICANDTQFSETTPNGLSIILLKFEDHRSDASPEMTCSGKHGTFHTVPNGLNILVPLFELEDLLES